MVAETIIQAGGDGFEDPITAEKSGLKRRAKTRRFFQIPAIVGPAVPPKTPDKSK
jgi:hypothetical protein